jgi:23S rRNA (cytosine1962-C5)-methyltransferase
MERINLITKPQAGYELLDSGAGEKFERFGDVILRRPDPQALWDKKLPEGEWDKANGTYMREGAEKGKWMGKLPQEWQVEFGGLKMIIKPSSFKHTGLFPEQLPNWEWIEKKVAGKGSPKVLNLFAYTGGATLALAKAGAEVTHVDASKAAVQWARDNAKASGLEDKPVRWIIEDVMAYVMREISRGSKYDGIVMDPPAFGHGPKDEIWKIEENFIELVGKCKELLSDNPLFFLINGYAEGYSPITFANNLEDLVSKYGGEIEAGELGIEDSAGRVLPAGIFARWSAN